jgi:spermidine synthase
VRLGVTVFLAGIASLATEMAASRLVAPAFGSSNAVWANVIGLMLAFLAAGYWLGGRLADARPARSTLATILVCSAATLAVVPFVAHPLLRLASRGVGDVEVGVVVGSFAAVLALFVVPVVLMGAVAPVALRLAISSVAESGRVAGRLYALSTAGSIVGTFASALVAIPLIGTQRTLIGCAALLGLAVVPLARVRGLAVAAAALALAAIPPGEVKRALWETESQYQYVRVVQNDDGSRSLELNEGVASQSLWYPDTVLTGGYWDLLAAIPSLVDRPRRALVLGNAAGTVPRAWAALYRSLAVDRVEIDPKVTEAGRRFFGLAGPVFTADARWFLERTDRRYDVIVVDAYRQPYVPFHLATAEFFRLVREHLTPNGVVALNVASTPADRRLTDGIAATLGSSFAEVWRWRALRFNDVLFAFATPRRPQASLPAPLRELRFAPTLLRPRGRPWTDDRAPVEWITDRMLVNQIRTGEGLEEEFLPTRP